MIFNRYVGAALCLAASVSFAQADPAGLWRAQDGGTILVSHCGSNYCATVASAPNDPITGKPPTDSHNADPSKRDRSVVGIPVLIDMKPDGSNKWSGSLYDRERGQIFPGHLIEIDSKTIRIEGCGMGICGGQALPRVNQ